MKINEPAPKNGGKPAPGGNPGGATAATGATGSRRWAIWLVLSLAYLIVFFQRVSPAVIVDKLFVQFQIEAAAAMGSLAAIYFYAYFLMQIPAGILNDSYGPRKVITAGVLTAALGSIWFGLAGSAAGLFAGRLLVGLGVSVIFVSLIKTYSAWFKPGELGTAMGLTVSLGNLGGILATSPLAALVELAGWRWSFAAVGLFSLLVAVLSWLIIRDRPQDVLNVFSARRGRSTRSGASAAGFRASEKAVREAFSWTATGRNIFLVLRNRHVWLALIAFFALYGPFMALVGIWGVPYLMQVYGLGRTNAATMMLMASLGLMLGTFAVGFFSDRAGSRKKVYLAFALGNAFVWAALVWWNQGMPPLQSLFLLYFLAGFGGNAGMLTPIMVKEYSPPALAGLASGIGNLGGFLGSAFMQPFFGFLLDVNWDGALAGGVKVYSQQAFQYAFGACFFSCCVAVIAVSLLRESFPK